MNTIALLVIITMLTLISILVMVYKIITKQSKTGSIIATCVLLLALIGVLTTTIIAKQHGCTTLNLPLNRLCKYITTTPRADKLPDDLSGSIIIFYRFDCPDCSDIYDTIRTHIDSYVQEHISEYDDVDYEHIYYIPTRSEQGKELISKFHITSVPTGVYVYENFDEDDPVFVQKTLDIKTSDETSILDTDALDRLLFLQLDNR